MANNTVQLRLVLDVRYDLNGTSVETLKNNLRRLADEAYADGRLSSGTDAEVDEHSISVMETPEPLDEGEIADFMLDRIDDGSLSAEDLPLKLARYGLMETPAFVAEIRERMASQKAEVLAAICGQHKALMRDGQGGSHDALPAQAFNEFVAQNQELIDELHVGYSTTIMVAPEKDLTAFFDEMVDDLKDSLGALAANECSDDEAEQDAAITAAESWVSENISASTEKCIAAVLYVMGIEAGSVELRRRLQ